MGQTYPTPNRRQPTLDFRQRNLSVYAFGTGGTPRYSNHRAGSAGIERFELMPSEFIFRHRY